MPVSDIDKPADRRASPRSAVVRPCKVFHVPTGRYLPGWTCDASSGGLLVRVQSPRALRPGDAVEVVIAWNRRVLLNASDATPARIARTLPGEKGEQFLGLAYASDAPAARIAA